jgi:hypothetical protein
MIRGRFTIQRIGTLTGSCAISGEPIRRHRARIQALLRIIGSITLTFPSCHRNDIATGTLAEANGT